MFGFASTSCIIHGFSKEGRVDSKRDIALFASEKKAALDNCKDTTMHLSDPLPIEGVHFVAKPNWNSRHQLREQLPKRGESKVEAFHDNLGDFSTIGMQHSLADDLHLIRHKRSFATCITTKERKQLSSARDKVARHWKRSEL